MPLETIRHTLPHLKGVNSDLQPSTKNYHGNTFAMYDTTLKSTHFPSNTGQAVVSYELAVCILIHESYDTKVCKSKLLTPFRTKLILESPIINLQKLFLRLHT